MTFQLIEYLLGGALLVDYHVHIAWSVQSIFIINVEVKFLGSFGIDGFCHWIIHIEEMHNRSERTTNKKLHCLWPDQ
jgi:hypothetical protein